MKAQIYNNIQTEYGLVQSLRDIRDNINRDIAGMTFEEERAYLDRLLAEKHSDNKEKADDTRPL